MTKLFKLQFLGPLALFLATLSAELAARALSAFPSSEWLWFVNLRLFGIFERSYCQLSEAFNLPGSQLFAIALPLFLLACYGLMSGRKLALALASNLSCVYAAFLLVSWQSPVATTAQASLGSINVPPGAGLYVLSAILGSSLLSALISHVLYLSEPRTAA